MAESDLLHYYKVLKQFLDISDDSTSRAKSNSSRAQRAREKLLKLSQGQFRELSTDVYDELRRRIDELRSEPDFLLPKLTFHPKRNQARQKLSLLPQLRFKDLVSDISYEIERRNLHFSEVTSSPDRSTSAAAANATSAAAANATFATANTASRSENQSAAPPYPVNSVSPSASGVAPSTLTEKFVSPGTLNEPESEKLQDEKPTNGPNGAFVDLGDELSTPDLKLLPQVSQKSIGIQSTAVVPTKADLAWLSDEESEQENLGNDVLDDNHPRRLSLGNLAKSTLADRSLQSDGDYSMSNGPSSDIPVMSDGSKAAAGALVGAAVGSTIALGTRSEDVANSEEFIALKAEKDKYAEQYEGGKADNEKHLKEIETTRAENSKLEEEMDVARAEIERLTTETVSLKNQVDALEKRNFDLQNDYASLEQTHSTLLTERAQMQDKVQQHEKAAESMPDPQEFASMKNELESVKVAAAALRLENQSLRGSQKELQRVSRDLSSISFEKNADTSPKSVPSLLSKSVELPLDVNSELKQFYQKLDQLAAPKTISESKEEALRAEIAQWRTRYENVQAGKLAEAFKGLKMPDLQRYVSPNGLVSLKVGVKFFALIDSFLFCINDPSTDNDILFDKISNIAVLSNKITYVGESSVLTSNDYSEAVREAITHSLTATRYLATYPLFLPKIIVERAVSQVAFAMCDYLSVSKMHLGSSSDGERNTDVGPIADEDVHVRPLKISSKLHSIPSIESDKEYSKKTESTQKQTPIVEGLQEETAPADFQDALSQSLPIPSRVREVPVTQSTEKQDDLPTSHDSAQPKKLSLFERILNAQIMGDTDDKSPEEKSDSGEPLRAERSPENMKENIAPEYKSPISKSATSLQGASRTVTRSPGSPKKSSILERVKQFESPPSGKSSPKASTRESPSISVKSARALFSGPEAVGTPGLKTKDAVSPEVSLTKPAEADTSVTPTRSRSIFQSIRDRFTQDSSAKAANTSKDADTTKDSIHAKDTVAPKDTEGSEGIDVLKNDLSAKEVDTSMDNVDVEDAGLSNEPELSREMVLESELESPLQVNKKETVIPEVPLNESVAKNVDVESTQEKGSIGAETAIKKDEITQSPAGIITGAIGTGTLAGAAAAAVSKASQSKSPLTSPVQKKTEIKEELELAGNSNLAEEPGSLSVKETELRAPSQKFNVGVTTRNFAAVRSPSFKVKKVNYTQDSKVESELEDDKVDDEDREEEEARQRQEYRKSMAAATFNFDLFDIDDPDNTLTQVLLYLEHQTVQVISTIQDLLTAIKKPDATRGELRTNSKAISAVISQMTEATNTSMNQTRNYQLKEHGSWVVRSLEDCNHRMSTLCRPNGEKEDLDFADKNFKQRLAGISFDIAKCTKELVKTVEEASLKEDIAQLDARLSHPDDLT